MRRSIPVTLLAAALATCCALVPAPARAETPTKLSLEILAGYGRASLAPLALAPARPPFPVRDDEAAGPVLGLRLGARGERLGWRVAVAREWGRFHYSTFDLTNETRHEGHREQWTLDASVEWSWAPTPRTKVLLFGGPGVVYRSTDAEEFERFSGSLKPSSSTRPAAHAGVGAEIQLGKRTYLRPDARGRWTTGGDASFGWETTVAIGWRLGAR